MVVIPDRIVLKFSGEVFKRENQLFYMPFANGLITQLQELVRQNKQIIIILGGGNICRGKDFRIFPSKSLANLNYAGMLATVINALFFREMCRKSGLKVGVLSLLQVDQQIVTSYTDARAQQLLRKHQVLIVCGGTGMPYFTTDTAASLLAHRLQASLILMGKKNVSGVYDQDPQIAKHAKRYRQLTYQTLIQKKLTVFDLTAATFNLDKTVTTLVFDLSQPNAILKVLTGQGDYTIISNHE